MSDVWKMVFFSVVFAMLLVGFVTVRQSGVGHVSSTTKACISNLKQLEGAKAVWALEHGKGTNDMPRWSEIIGKTNYLESKPICPQGGSYTLGAVGTTARCTVPGHVLPP